MDQIVLSTLIFLSNKLNNEILTLILLLACYATILILWRFWQENGLFIYNALAVVIANIQVLKISNFSITNEPVALGTLLFATTFIVSDILTEHKGIQSARIGINLSFIAQIFVTLLMNITILFSTIDGADIRGTNGNSNILNNIQYSMFILFVPSLRILTASLISYYVSQLFDIYLFKLIKTLTREKFLWLRLNISSMMAGLLDNVLFSLLAWKLLSPNPVSLHILIFTYIFGTYGSRLIISLTSTPIIYLSYKFKKN